MMSIVMWPSHLWGSAAQISVTGYLVGAKAAMQNAGDCQRLRALGCFARQGRLHVRHMCAPCSASMRYTCASLILLESSSI